MAADLIHPERSLPGTEAAWSSVRARSDTAASWPIRAVRSMRDRVNALVKMREAFRPFAPAVSLEEVDPLVRGRARHHLPYMTVNVKVRPEHRASLPAITHVDGSARVQTASGRDNPEFRALLRAVGERTGRQMVLNTSFNVKGQAIVNTPADPRNAAQQRHRGAVPREHARPQAVLVT